MYPSAVANGRRSDAMAPAIGRTALRGIEVQAVEMFDQATMLSNIGIST
jgi:hypothetical protein